MTAKSVLILGAKSDIGLAIAHRFAATGHSVQLAMRQAEAHSPIRSDIEIRHGVTATLHEFDALETHGHGKFIDNLPALPDVAICVIGFSEPQAKSEQHNEVAIRVLRSNFEGPVSVLGILANKFEARQAGTIVGISSVAGERGRRSNYIYGSAKAGFTTFLSGLRNRLTDKNVNVVTILPGFVRTRMTEDIALPTLITSSPAAIGDLVYKAVKDGNDVVYSRWWFFIMAIIRMIPERIFKRLSL